MIWTGNKIEGDMLEEEVEEVLRNIKHYHDNHFLDKDG